MEKIFTFDGIIFKFELFYHVGAFNNDYPNIIWVEIDKEYFTVLKDESSMEFLGRLFDNLAERYQNECLEKYEQFRDFADKIFCEFFNVGYREYPKF